MNDFELVAKEISFKTLLDYWNIPYTEDAREIKTDEIIISKDKGLFFHKKGGKGGSITQFVADKTSVRNYEAMKWLKKTFLTAPKELKKEIPTLTLLPDKWLQENGISDEIAAKYEVGRVKEKSVLAGCIAFRILREDKTPAGYVGYRPEKNEWVFPKGSKRGDIVYNLHNQRKDGVILVSNILDCLHLISLGFDYSIALMAEHATEDQILMIGQSFKRILIIHKNPDNLLQRLGKYCFCKAVNCNSVRELSDDDVYFMF